jgi:hypothetical protein
MAIFESGIEFDTLWPVLHFCEGANGSIRSGKGWFESKTGQAFQDVGGNSQRHVPIISSFRWALVVWLLATNPYTSPSLQPNPTLASGNKGSQEASGKAGELGRLGPRMESLFKMVAAERSKKVSEEGRGRESVLQLCSYPVSPGRLLL